MSNQYLLSFAPLKISNVPLRVFNTHHSFLSFAPFENPDVSTRVLNTNQPFLPFATSIYPDLSGWKGCAHALFLPGLSLEISSFAVPLLDADYSPTPFPPLIMSDVAVFKFHAL